ncbi:MAG: hypothetical protein HYS13_24530 [Planctomycetia bacterium]|nr:hypothetical protein [Planctomycetia bacterium]
MNAFGTALGAYAADLAPLSTVFLLFALAVMAVLRRPGDRLNWGWATIVGLMLVTIAPALPAWPRIDATTWFARDTTVAPVVDEGRPAASGFATSALPASQETVGEPTFAAGPAAWPPRADAAFAAPDMVPLPGPSPADFDPVPGEMPVTLAAVAEVRPEGGLSWPQIAVAVWLCVVLLSAGWIALGACHANRLVRRSAPAPEWIGAELHRLAGGRPAPRAKISSRIATPMVLSVVRPVVLLPESSLDDGQRNVVRAALAHEWAHVRHGDLWLLALERLLFPIFSAQPLFWLLCRKVRFAQEVCADAAAAGESPLPYAEAVLAWAKAAAPRPAAGGWLRMAMWTHPETLTRRIEMILHSKSRSSSPNRKWRCAALLLAAAVAIGLSVFTLRPAAHAQDKAAEGPKASAPADAPAQAAQEAPPAKPAAPAALSQTPPAKAPPSADDPQNVPQLAPTEAEPVVKLLHLKYHNADELAKLLGKVLAEQENAPKMRIVADPRTNSLLLQGRAQDVQFVEALVAVLQELAAAAEKPRAAATRTGPAYPPAMTPRPAESKPSANVPPSASGSFSLATVRPMPNQVGQSTTPAQPLTLKAKPAPDVEISLLELDLAEAKLDLEAATERHDQAKQLSESNAVSQGELKQRLYDMEKAKIHLRRIEILLNAAKEGKTAPSRVTR